MLQERAQTHTLRALQVANTCSFTKQHARALRCEKQGSVCAALQGFPRSWFVGKLYKALTRGPAPVVHHHHSPLHWPELRERLFQQLIGDHWGQVSHCESRTVSGETDADGPVPDHSAIQLGFSYLR